MWGEGEDWEEETFTCDKCGEEYLEGEQYEIDGQEICDDCYGEMDED